MKATYRVLTPQDLASGEIASQAFALDVLTGLSENPKRLQSKYFYDDEGSRLFQQIMALPEYYLTRCERDILTRCRQDIADPIAGQPFLLVELGAGDGQKTRILIDHFLQRRLSFTYVPVDISEGAMQTLTTTLSREFSRLDIGGIIAEYFDGLKWLSGQTERRKLVLFLGSNIGNFNRPQAKYFLRNLWNALNDGDIVLIGFDLKKDIDLMLKAYNDSRGITAAFNFNLLKRINRELAGDFDIDKFRFYASYDVFSGAIESYLVSIEAQTASIKSIGQSFHFKPWEPIHMEYSYKFLPSDIEELARETGYTILQHLTDGKGYFCDSIWRVNKT